MDGIILSKNSREDTLFCTVSSFSEEIQDLVRNCLSKICFGDKKASSGNPIYSYELTLKEFLKRYDSKNSEIKTGMLGELLCHVLLLQLCPQFRAASPYFNSEESSIKKGFDAILFSTASEAAWFTEVKAGAVGSAKTPIKKMRVLMDLARSDLATRIAENDSTTWYSAINNVEISLKDGERAKDILVSILSGAIISNDPKCSQPTSHCAVLVPVLFEEATNSVSFTEFEAKAELIHEGKTFSQCVIFGIQKSTLIRLEKFLRDELK